MEYAQYVSRVLLKMARTGELYDPVPLQEPHNTMSIPIPNGKPKASEVGTDGTNHTPTPENELIPADMDDTSTISDATVRTSNMTEPEKSSGSGEQDNPEIDDNAHEPPEPDNIIQEKNREPPDPSVDITKDNANASTIFPPEPDFVPADEGGRSQTYRKIVAKYDTDNPEKFRKYLAFLPTKVVKWTFAKTTQLCKSFVHYPLLKHVKSRFAWMNKFRLNEKVSTDTIFANCRAIGGYPCAQVFYGMTSHVINVCGMRTEKELPEIYKDFICHEGIPSVLRQDGANAQKSKEVQDI